MRPGRQRSALPEVPEAVRSYPDPELFRSGCHVNDGVHAVDVEEKGNQEEENLLVFLQFSKHMAEPAKSGGDRVIVIFDTVKLFIASKKRYRKADPPDSDEQKCNAHARFIEIPSVS